MVDEHDAMTSDTVGCRRGRRLDQQRAQRGEVDAAMAQGIVERRPVALHGKREVDRAVRAGGLRDGIDQFQQGSGPLGEGLIYLLAELRQLFECIHTRQSARSSAVWQGPLL